MKKKSPLRGDAYNRCRSEIDSSKYNSLFVKQHPKNNNNDCMTEISNDMTPPKHLFIREKDADV
jgi:hypothetical protein